MDFDVVVIGAGHAGVEAAWAASRLGCRVGLCTLSDATVAQLAARGIRLEEPGSPDGSSDFWTAWVTDPDGYRIELVQWPEGHPDGMTRSDFADPDQSR